jgi:hypothetical protein
MGQQDVVDWLRQNPGWHKTTDVAKALDRGIKGVNENLQTACSWGDIKSRRSESGPAKERRSA